MLWFGVCLSYFFSCDHHSILTRRSNVWCHCVVCCCIVPDVITVNWIMMRRYCLCTFLHKWLIISYLLLSVGRKTLFLEQFSDQSDKLLVLLPSGMNDTPPKKYKFLVFTQSALRWWMERSGFGWVYIIRLFTWTFYQMRLQWRLMCGAISIITRLTSCLSEGTAARVGDVLAVFNASVWCWYLWEILIEPERQRSRIPINTEWCNYLQRRTFHSQISVKNIQQFNKIKGFPITMMQWVRICHGYIYIF